MFLDGTVKINGNDLLTIGGEVDGPVKVDITTKQIQHAGSAPVDTITDDVGTGVNITLSGVVLDKRQLQYLVGMAKTSGYLEDGVTPADLYSFGNKAATFGQRPYVQLLVQGNKTGTTNKVEIWALRAKLMGNFSMALDKDNHTKVELQLKCHADPNDRTATWFQVRDSEVSS